MATQRTIVSRLADAGEEAIQRVAGAPAADRLVKSVNGLRERVDDMQRKLRGFDALEKRLKSVERRLDKLEGKGSGTKSSSSSSSSSRSSTTRKKSSSS
jgi:hypothetical protein